MNDTLRNRGWYDKLKSYIMTARETPLRDAFDNPMHALTNALGKQLIIPEDLPPMARAVAEAINPDPNSAARRLIAQQALVGGTIKSVVDDPLAAALSMAATKAPEGALNLYREATPLNVRAYLHHFYGAGQPLTRIPKKLTKPLERIGERIMAEARVNAEERMRARSINARLRFNGRDKKVAIKPHWLHDVPPASPHADDVVNLAEYMPAKDTYWRGSKAAVPPRSLYSGAYGKLAPNPNLLVPMPELLLEDQIKTSLGKYFTKYDRAGTPIGIEDHYRFFPEVYGWDEHTTLLDVVKPALGPNFSLASLVGWQARSNLEAYVPRYLGARYGTPYNIDVPLPSGIGAPNAFDYAARTAGGGIGAAEIVGRTQQEQLRDRITAYFNRPIVP